MKCVSHAGGARLLRRAATSLFWKGVALLLLAPRAGGAAPGENCEPDVPERFWSILKHSSFRQLSADEVVPASDFPHTFSVVAQESAGWPNPLTHVTLTLPNGTTAELTNVPPRFERVVSLATEGDMDLRQPPGIYLIHLGRQDGPEDIVETEMLQSHTTIPRVTNFDETQAVDSARTFVLRWNAFDPLPPGAFISVIITDEFGNKVFRAPNPCLSRELSPEDTSMVIPADTFRPNQRHLGVIQFGLNFHSSTNDPPGMSGSGMILRATSFELRTIPASAPPPRIVAHPMSENGEPRLVVVGAPGETCEVQRAAALGESVWTVVGTVTLGADGEGGFEDEDPGVAPPVFYRAVGSP